MWGVILYYKSNIIFVVVFICMFVMNKYVIYINIMLVRMEWMRENGIEIEKYF